MGWGQVGQHRSFGHKGGLGRSGHLKHLASTVIKEDQDHFGHESTHPPHPNIAKKWINVRDLDDLFSKSGKTEGSKNVLDLTSLEIDKLLGGGEINNAYTVIVKQASSAAQEKIKKSGGEVTLPVQKTDKNIEVPAQEAKTEDVENNDG
jgi:large subunit ribosomal protein L15